MDFFFCCTQEHGLTFIFSVAYHQTWFMLCLFAAEAVRSGRQEVRGLLDPADRVHPRGAVVPQHHRRRLHRAGERRGGALQLGAPAAGRRREVAHARRQARLHRLVQDHQGHAGPPRQTRYEFLFIAQISL